MHLLLSFRCYKANSLIQTKAQSFTGSFFIWRHFANQVPRNRAKTTASSTCVTHNHHLADCQAIKRTGSRQMQHTVSLWLIIAPYRNLVWLLMHSCDSIWCFLHWHFLKVSAPWQYHQTSTRQHLDNALLGTPCPNKTQNHSHALSIPKNTTCSTSGSCQACQASHCGQASLLDGSSNFLVPPKVKYAKSSPKSKRL